MRRAGLNVAVRRHDCHHAWRRGRSEGRRGSPAWRSNRHTRRLSRPVRRSVVHHYYLVNIVVKVEKGSYGSLYGDLLIICRDYDRYGYVEVVPQLVFKHVAPPCAVKGGRSHRNRKEEKACISDEIDDEENAYYLKEKLKIAGQHIRHFATSPPFISSFSSSLYIIISLAYLSPPLIMSRSFS